MRNVAATVVALMVSTMAPVLAADPEPSGRGEYLRYCSACHGPLAKGDGVAAGLMRPTPPDLTKLAARHGGEFPMTLVVQRIDGREMPRAHGTPAMPVWGQILAEELGSTGDRPVAVERRVQTRIYTIAEYLRSIQTK
jgi:mono/diheme cytochrome c family protein